MDQQKNNYKPKISTPRILVVANQKGGVGKTTTAVNLGTAMAACELQVLLIDLDPQGNASTGLGINEEERIPRLYQLLTKNAFDEASIKKTLVPNMDIITSTQDLSAAEIELIDIKDREKILKNILTKTQNYDYILIDCPPTLGLLTINGLVAAHSVMIPMQCEFFALEGLSALINIVCYYLVNSFVSMSYTA